MLLTRQGCHLCVEAEALVRGACEDLDVAWRLVDVDADERLKARYGDHVPVTFVDQRLLGYWFVDDDALRLALAEDARPMPPDWILAQH